MNPTTTEVLDAVDEALKHPLPFRLKVKAYQLRYDAKTKHRKPGRARLEAFIALTKKASKPSKAMAKKPALKPHVNGSIRAYVRQQIMKNPDDPMLIKAWAEINGEP